MSESTADNFSSLDESGISRFQLKIMFVSGMGFFTDAYDLFVIGIVVALIKTRKPAASTAVESKARHSQSVASGYLKLFQNKRLLIWLIGTAGGWALLDFC
jgi:hypothetical protein